MHTHTFAPKQYTQSAANTANKMLMPVMLAGSVVPHPTKDPAAAGGSATGSPSSPQPCCPHRQIPTASCSCRVWRQSLHPSPNVPRPMQDKLQSGKAKLAGSQGAGLHKRQDADEQHCSRLRWLLQTLGLRGLWRPCCCASLAAGPAVALAGSKLLRASATTTASRPARRRHNRRAWTDSSVRRRNLLRLLSTAGSSMVGSRLLLCRWFRCRMHLLLLLLR